MPIFLLLSFIVFCSSSDAEDSDDTVRTVYDLDLFPGGNVNNVIDFSCSYALKDLYETTKDPKYYYYLGHYFIYGRSRPNLGQMFLGLAARKDHPFAQYDYGQILCDSGDVESMKGGVDWLEKAHKNGILFASKELEKCKELIKTKATSK